MISLTAYASPFASYADALTAAVAAGHSIGKYADPTEPARTLTVDEAAAVADEDPSLLYIVYGG